MAEFDSVGSDTISHVTDSRTTLSAGRHDRRIVLVLGLLLVLISGVFIVALFKNLGSPLMWNDEAEAAMFGRHILKYGYPKIHGDRYTLFASPLELKDAVHDQHDSFVASTWGHFYLGALGVWWGGNSVDDYQRTWRLRFPFVIIGLIGLGIVLLLTVSLLGGTTIARLSAAILFIFIEATSVLLCLHLRQARYYAIAVFVGALFLLFYLRWMNQEKARCWSYIIGGSLALILSFQAFYPFFFILCATTTLHQAWHAILRWRSGGEWRNRFLGGMSPIIIAVVLQLPLFAYFQVFTSIGAFGIDNFGVAQYFDNLRRIVAILAQYDWLIPAVALQVIVIVCRSRFRALALPAVTRMSTATDFVLILWGVHLFVIARIPFLFERYFVHLQPLLPMLIILNLGILLSLRLRRHVLLCYLGLVLLAGCVNFDRRLLLLQDYVQELRHEYHGPIDFVVAYVRQHYAHPDRLIVATNYEEQVYMYYLECRTIVGFAGQNIDADLFETPDIVIIRQHWPRYKEALAGFLKRADYETIRLPVRDYPVNNIPTLMYQHGHLFESPIVRPGPDSLTIFRLLREPRTGND